MPGPGGPGRGPNPGPDQGQEVNYIAPSLPGPRVMDPPYQGEVTLGGGGGKDIAGGFIDALLPFWRWENSLLFINPRFNFGKTWNTFDDDQGDLQSGSLGLGYRLHLEEAGLILGANVYYDHLWSAKNNKFEQIGAGLEVMHQWFDFRFNYYWPLNDRERYDTLHTQQVTSWTEDWSRQWRSSSRQYDGVVAQGHHVYQRSNWSWADNRQDWRSTFTQTFSQTFDLYEVALEGFDAEVGLHVPLPEAWGELRLFGGYMYFDSDYTDKYDGFTARLEYRPVRAIAFDAQWLEEDQFLGSNWTAGVRLILPFDMGALVQGQNPFHNIGEWFSPGSRSLDQRLTEMVKRDSYTHNAGEARERVQERSLTTTKEDTLLAQYVTARGSGTDLNPLLGPDGNPLFFYFVDPLRSTGSDGSYEDPFATHLDGLNALGTSGRAYEGLSLAAGQSYVDASGVTHLINLDNTPLNGVLITGNWQAFAQEYFTGSAPADGPRAAWTTGQLKITGATHDQPVLVSDIDFTSNGAALTYEGLLHIDLVDGNIDVWRSSATGSTGDGIYAIVQNEGDITMESLKAVGSASSGIIALIRNISGNISQSNLRAENNGDYGVHAWVGRGDISQSHITSTGNSGHGVSAIINGRGNISQSNLRAENNSQSGVEARGGNGNISQSHITSTGSGGNGVYALLLGDGNITMDTVSAAHSALDGVYIDIGGSGSVLANSVTATNNQRNGIWVNRAVQGDMAFTNSNASNNAGHGIYVNGAVSGNADFSSVMASGNQQGSGISVGGAITGNADFSNAQASGNDHHGIHVQDAVSGAADFSNVAASHNGQGGIYVQGDLNGAADFSQAQASDNGWNGIDVNGAIGGQADFSQASASGNAWNGILVNGDIQGNADFSSVTASGNEDGIGIAVMGDITGQADFSNAVASGNKKGSTGLAGYGSGVYVSGGVGGDLNAVNLKTENNEHYGISVNGAIGGQADFSSAQASGNGSHGIAVAAISGQADFSGVQANNNGQSGISAGSVLGGKAVFDNVTVTNNDEDGIVIFRLSAEASFNGAQLTDNDSNGLYLNDIAASAKADFSNITASQNYSNGIYVHTINGQALFTGVTAQNNGAPTTTHGYGLEINAINTGSSAEFSNITADGNKELGNASDGLGNTFTGIKFINAPQGSLSFDANSITPKTP